MKNLNYFIAAVFAVILMGATLDVNAQSDRRGNNGGYHQDDDYDNDGYRNGNDNRYGNGYHDHDGHQCNDRSCNHGNNYNNRYNTRYDENITRQYYRHYDRYFSGCRSYREQQIAARNFEIHVRHCGVCQSYQRRMARRGYYRGVRVVGSGGYRGR